MTIYKKPDLKVFGANAKPTEIAEFEDLLRGWGITIEKTNGIPPMEWFNYLFNRLDGNINYILQNGITEYDTNLEYPQNAVVKSNGKLYLCLRQNTNKPLSNGAYWELLIKNATTSQSGIVQLSSSVTSADEKIASTSLAVKKANDNANNRVSKDGDTMIGDLVINRSDYSSLILKNTKNKSLYFSAVPDNAKNIGSIAYRAEQGSNEHLIYVPKKTGTILLDSDKSDAVNLDSSVNVATSKAIYTLNKAKFDKSGGEITGNLTINKKLAMLTVRDQNVSCGFKVYNQTKKAYFELNDGQKTSYIYLPNKTGNLCLREEGVPAGAIMAFAGERVPDGWLRMDNGYYDPNTYPELFAVLGYYYGQQGNKFLVPSIENRFIRGMANGLKRGQKQEDAIRNIQGGAYGFLNTRDLTNTYGCFGKGKSDSLNGQATEDNNNIALTFDASLVVPTAEENRPKAIAFPYIIKY